jgi:hypothetical protein
MACATCVVAHPVTVSWVEVHHARNVPLSPLGKPIHTMDHLVARPTRQASLGHHQPRA